MSPDNINIIENTSRLRILVVLGRRNTMYQNKFKNKDGDPVECCAPVSVSRCVRDSGSCFGNVFRFLGCGGLEVLAWVSVKPVCSCAESLVSFCVAASFWVFAGGKVSFPCVSVIVCQGG